MDRTAPPATTPLAEVLDRLARFEPTHLPVVSLYLNLQADQHGKDNFAPFVRKELPQRVAAYPAGSEARESLDRDVARIEAYLAELPPSANGLALFACSGLDGFFEAVLLDAPIQSHRLSIAPEPHLYPLALAIDQHPPHAVVLTDSHSARIYLFALGQTLRSETVESREKVKRIAAGGWSQMRYQRHVDELQAEQAREMVAALDKLVRDEGIEHVILAGDEVLVPLVRAELGQELAAKVIDTVKMDARTPEHEIMRAAADILREHDTKSDAEVVERVVGEYLAGGLGAVGAEAVRAALEQGRVSELYLTAVDPGGTETVADELVARAKQTSAQVRFIEDRALLQSHDGVAALLRW